MKQKTACLTTASNIFFLLFCSPPYRSPNDSPSHCYDIPFPIDDKTKNGHIDGEPEAAGASHNTAENGATSSSAITSSKPPSGAATATTTTTAGGSSGAGARMSKSFTTTFADPIQSSNGPSDTGHHHHHEHHHHHHRQHHESGTTTATSRLCKNSNSLDESLGAPTAATNGFHKQPGMPQSFSMHDFDDRDRSFQQQQRPHYTPNDIDKEDLKRLMGAASFGYGLFQLSVSLLPPNLLKLISFFGFEGDRRIGIACLKHSRQSEDMRAPLAT